MAHAMNFYIGLMVILSLTISPRNSVLCVPAYIFLSGYGLGKVYCKKALSGQSMGNGKRCFNLYVRLWVIIAIFVPIGSYFNPEHYPYSMLELVENMTGISTYYNGACKHAKTKSI